MIGARGNFRWPTQVKHHNISQFTDVSTSFVLAAPHPPSAFLEIDRAVMALAHQG